MRFKHLTIVILLLLILSACSTQTPTPTPTIAVTPTEELPPTPTETLAPSPTLEPTVEPTATLQATIPAPPLEESGVLATTDFLMAAPQGAATTVEWNQVNGTPFDPNVPPYLNGLPPHLLVVFDKEAVSLSTFNPNERQGRVLPTDAYKAMYAQAGLPDVENLINDLQVLLDEQPAEISGGIPVLPALNAVQIYHARVQYLQFSGGEGIAFISSYGQDVSPITNDNLYYFFQGLSNDGEQYVSFVYPVLSADLPDSIDQVPQDTITALEADPAAYYAGIAELLNNAAVNSFTPNLEVLTAMFRSISITTPAAVAPTQPAVTQPASTQPSTSVTAQPTVVATQNLTPQPTVSFLPTFTPTPVYAGAEILGRWFWISLAPASGNTISPPDPDRYSVTFNANGTVSVVSDCNTASGTYTLRRENLTVDFTSGTTEDCGSSSQSGVFIDAVEDASTYVIDGDDMTIRLKSGGTLRLSR